jgi:hypothetical protein
VWYLVAKAAISGLLVAAASEVARRWPSFGALIVSLPLVAILAMAWLWRDSHDEARIAALSQSTFWFVLPSLPMFLAIPWLMRHGASFGVALALGCALTTALYLLMLAVGPKMGLRL